MSDYLGRTDVQAACEEYKAATGTVRCVCALIQIGVQIGRQEERARRARARILNVARKVNESYPLGTFDDDPGGPWIAPGVRAADAQPDGCGSESE